MLNTACNIGSLLALNGSTMHVATLIGSDRVMNLALLFEVIWTLFPLSGFVAYEVKKNVNY